LDFLQQSLLYRGKSNRHDKCKDECCQILASQLHNTVEKCNAYNRHYVCG
jgi:hypothetical protein